MPRILETGQRHNLVPNESGSAGTSDEYRFVTFVGDYGDTHTVFVHPDHPLTDARQIVQAYYDGTLTTQPPEQEQQQQQQQAPPGVFQ